MVEVSYYREWFLNCSNGIVPGILAEDLKRTPWGEISAMRRLYNSLLMPERAKFIQAMKELLVDQKISTRAKIMLIDFSRPRAIWDIEPEVRALDGELPKEPWDYDKRNPPKDEREIYQINLRAAVNKFLFICNRDRAVA
jgi:hypothetical protein